jgi:hypothetical protein
VFCTITTLRKNGLRHRRSEWPDPVAGQLRVGTWDAATNSFGRTVRQAELIQEYGVNTRPVLILFEPELIDVPDQGQLLRGVDLERKEGRTFEHQQLWLVRPAALRQTPPQVLDATGSEHP